MQIPNWPISTGREIELLREVLESGRWGGHSDFVKRLEREFAGFTHCAHAVSAMNGTVIVPAISFVSTAMAVSRVGATPVFVDIELLSFKRTTREIASAIRKACIEVKPS